MLRRMKSGSLLAFLLLGQLILVVWAHGEHHHQHVGRGDRDLEPMELAFSPFQSSPSLSNTDRRGLCATPEQSEQQLERQKSVLAMYHALDSNNRRRREEELCTRCVEIDIYFHVVTETDESSGRVLDEQIQQQVDVLNDGFSGSPFNFTLRGTTRTSNSSLFDVRLFNYDFASMQSALGTDLRVGDRRTLNIYTLKLLPATLGLSTFPSGFDGAKDGVFVEHCSVPGGSCPQYNSGKILIHEVGHWLGLLHVFQGGCESEHGDYVSDTPPQDSSIWIPSCQPVPQSFSCNNPDAADPLENYMGYAMDCLDSFTPGQQMRMYDEWMVYRSGNQPCDDDEGVMEVDLRLDQNPEQNSWVLMHANGDLISLTSFGSVEEHREQTLRICVPYDTSLYFSLMDDVGDGFTDENSHFIVKVDGKTVKNDLTFGGRGVAAFTIQNDVGCPPGENSAKIDLLLDDFPTETSWEILRDQEVVYTEAPYKLFGSGFYYEHASILREVCLPVGGYTLKLNDKFGDGFSETDQDETPFFRVTVGSNIGEKQLWNNRTSEITYDFHVAEEGETNFDGDFPDITVSELPSAQPTTQPSETPSEFPSVNPSQSPSVESSAMPTIKVSALLNAFSVTPSSVPTTTSSDAPTRIESTSPTIQTSSRPSLSSSTTPTIRQSDSPSVGPSSVPSLNPTEKASLSPSSPPSLQPTQTASSNPSSAASYTPTLNASAIPTLTPSREPSAAPITEMSLHPTGVPSQSPNQQNSSVPPAVESSPPSVYTSMAPSSAPSRMPSSFPTTLPSGTPSDLPSDSPSHQESIGPTVETSTSPTIQRSSRPSMGEGMKPSATVSSLRSANSSVPPLSRPSIVPSYLPSGTPTPFLSDSPTNVSSDSPSSQQSSGPTLEESSSPTIQQSSSPSLVDSARPSIALSLLPSVIPSTSPSSGPSLVVSTYPSISESTVPSSSPSTYPSWTPSIGLSESPTVESSECDESLEEYSYHTSEISVSSITCTDPEDVSMIGEILVDYVDIPNSIFDVAQNTPPTAMCTSLLTENSCGATVDAEGVSSTHLWKGGSICGVERENSKCNRMRRELKKDDDVDSDEEVPVLFNGLDALMPRLRVEKWMTSEQKTVMTNYLQSLDKMRAKFERKVQEWELERNGLGAKHKDATAELTGRTRDETRKWDEGFSGLQQELNDEEKKLRDEKQNYGKKKFRTKMKALEEENQNKLEAYRATKDNLIEELGKEKVELDESFIEDVASLEAEVASLSLEQTAQQNGLAFEAASFYFAWESDWLGAQARTAAVVEFEASLEIELREIFVADRELQLRCFATGDHPQVSVTITRVDTKTEAQAHTC